MATVPIEQRIIDCEQGSADWMAARCGCITSCRAAGAIAKLKRKDGESAERRRMRYEVVCEMLTGNAAQHYVSDAMNQGREREPLARVEYEILRNCSVRQIGFVYHPTIKRAGASPDGWVGSDGVIEIKAPLVTTHLEYMALDVIPDEYLPQMLWQLACSERQWCDFVSYSPEMPEQYQLFVKRLERTPEVDATIRGMELEVEQFLSECDDLLAKLKAKVS